MQKAATRRASPISPLGETPNVWFQLPSDATTLENMLREPVRAAAVDPSGDRPLFEELDEAVQREHRPGPGSRRITTCSCAVSASTSSSGSCGSSCTASWPSPWPRSSPVTSRRTSATQRCPSKAPRRCSLSATSPRRGRASSEEVVDTHSPPDDPATGEVEPEVVPGALDRLRRHPGRPPQAQRRRLHRLRQPRVVPTLTTRRQNRYHHAVGALYLDEEHGSWRAAMATWNYLNFDLLLSKKETVQYEARVIGVPAHRPASRSVPASVRRDLTRDPAVGAWIPAVPASEASCGPSQRARRQGLRWRALRAIFTGKIALAWTRSWTRSLAEKPMGSGCGSGSTKPPTSSGCRGSCCTTRGQVVPGPVGDQPAHSVPDVASEPELH